MTVTKTKKPKPSVSSTAAANGPGETVTAESVPVPPSETGPVDGSGNGGGNDPWVSHDPWVQPSNPDPWKPSLDGYLQFCAWWTAMTSESNETSFSTRDSGGHAGKGYGSGGPMEGKGKGKGGRSHRHRDGFDPGQQQQGHRADRGFPQEFFRTNTIMAAQEFSRIDSKAAQAFSRTNNGCTECPPEQKVGSGCWRQAVALGMLSKAPFEWNQPSFRGPRSDPGVRRGGAAGLGGDPPGRGPGDEDDDPEDGEDSASLPRLVVWVRRRGQIMEVVMIPIGLTLMEVQPEQVKSRPCSSVGGAIRNDPSLRSVL